MVATSMLAVLAVAFLAVAVTLEIARRKLSASAELGRYKYERLRARFAALYDDSPDAIASYDLQGRLLHGNAAAIALLGYAPGEMLGRHFSTHIAPETLDETVTAFDRAVAGSTEYFVTRFIDARGGRLDVLATISPIHESGAPIADAIVLHVDPAGEQRMLGRESDRRPVEGRAPVETRGE